MATPSSFAGRWRLVAAADGYAECPVIDEKLAVPHQTAWLAGPDDALVSRDDFTPLHGALETRTGADDDAVGYVTLPGQSEFDDIVQGRHGELVLRCDDGNVTLCEFVAIARHRLVRTLNCIGDAFYFSRFVAVYEPLDG